MRKWAGRYGIARANSAAGRYASARTQAGQWPELNPHRPTLGPQGASSAGRPAVQRWQGAKEVGAGRATTLGEDLVRAEQTVRVEHLLDAAHQTDGDWAEVFLQELL